MKLTRTDSSKMRVAVVSASRSQREHLKRLIEEHGPKVIGVSSFQDYYRAAGAQKPDVLLIDLDQADDASLARLERMVDQSKIPILFNESTAIPMMPGPYRDDWVDNLVGKLYGLAQKQHTAPSSTLLDRPRFSNTAPRHALPKVLVISHSKTRRRVLQIILASHAIKDTAETNYIAGYDRDNIAKYDLLLLDEHNVGPEDSAAFEQLLSQSQVPVQICNSSHIPPAASERNQWGMKLAGQLIKLAKARSAINKVPQTTTEETPIEEQWGDRIASTLTVVRETITNGAAHTEPGKPTQDAAQAKNVKTAAAPLPLPAATPRKDLKYRSPKNTGGSMNRTASKTSNEVTAAKVTGNAETQIPNKFAKPKSPTIDITPIVDATTPDVVRNDSTMDNTINNMTLDEQSSEIARFFNFDFNPELNLEPKNEQPHNSPTKKVTSTKIRENVSQQKKTLKKLASSRIEKTNSMKMWFRSLAAMRQKLPKIFN